MIFIDSNIPMYIIGAAHPNKAAAVLLLEELIRKEYTLVTDAEVYQEILHRYTAINRREAIDPAMKFLSSIIDEVYPVDIDLVTEASGIIVHSEGISARDALHIAVMQRYKIHEIATFDTDFDKIQGLRRLPG